jgi:hypothetical protein
MLVAMNIMEGAGINPAPSNYLTVKVVWFGELNKKEGAG